jgi:hypothetical protein
MNLASRCGPRSRFQSLPDAAVFDDRRIVRNKTPIAAVAQRKSAAPNAEAAGSNPAGGSIAIAQWVEQLTHHQSGAGSSPASKPACQGSLTNRSARATADLRARVRTARIPACGSFSALQQGRNKSGPKPASAKPAGEDRPARAAKDARRPPVGAPAARAGAEAPSPPIHKLRRRVDKRSASATVT